MIAQKFVRKIKQKLKKIPILSLGLFSLAIVPGLMMIGFVSTVTLTCERTEQSQGNCDLEESGLLGSSFTEIPIESLQGAQIIKKNIEDLADSDYSAFYVALLTENGRVFLPFYRLDHHYAQDVVAQINDFIDNPETLVLEIDEDSRSSAYLWGAMLLGVGGGLFSTWVSRAKRFNCF